VLSQKTVRLLDYRIVPYPMLSTRLGSPSFLWSSSVQNPYKPFPTEGWAESVSATIWSAAKWSRSVPRILNQSHE